MSISFILKLLVVVAFLVMFLRGSKIVWGVGLLTVSSALLLDTMLGTFGRQELQAELGFFFDVLSGALFAGAALWLWGLLRPLLAQEDSMGANVARTAPLAAAERASLASQPQADPPRVADEDTVVDRQMLYEEMRTRLGPQDVRDLIFDLELKENDVLAPQQTMTESITRIINRAEQQGKMGALALAVERLLTPLPPESLPRREKLSVESPPTVLRQYLLAHCSLQTLTDMADSLDVDWERLGTNNKQETARNLLLYLQRRNRLGELIDLLQAGERLGEEE